MKKLHNQKDYSDEAFGEQIEFVHELEKYAKDKRSVLCPTMWGVLPCAVVMSMQARTVLRIINNGLYLYVPKSERQNNEE